MAEANGDFDPVNQSQLASLSGGAAAQQMVTTDGSPKTPGNGGKWDADGNWVDSGMPITGGTALTPILDASGNPILDASGNWIY